MHPPLLLTLWTNEFYRQYSSRTNEELAKLNKISDRAITAFDKLISRDATVSKQLQAISKAMTRLEHRLEGKEREELLRQLKSSDDAATSASSNRKRMSVVSYNSSLRISLHNLESIISLSADTSRTTSIAITEDKTPPSLPKADTGLPDLSITDDLISLKYHADANLEDVEKYRAILHDIVRRLQSDNEAPTDLSKAATPDTTSDFLHEKSEFDDSNKSNRKSKPCNNVLRRSISSDSHRPQYKRSFAGESISVNAGGTEIMEGPLTAPLPTTSPMEDFSPESSLHSALDPSSLLEYTDKREYEMMKLIDRVHDWKGNKRSHFGNLITVGFLLVAQVESVTSPRHFHVYLFENILLFLKPSKTEEASTSVWKLKGRIWMYNISYLGPVKTDKKGKGTCCIVWDQEDTEVKTTIVCDDLEAASRWAQLIARQMRLSPMAQSYRHRKCLQPTCR